MDPENLIGLTGPKVLNELLVSHDVKHIFGYPGGVAFPLFDGLLQAAQIEFIIAHHDQCAGHMAEGYARASGRPGVVMVTSGPETSNVVTPMLDALLYGTPIVVICGQGTTSVLGATEFQETDVLASSRTCTKWSTCVQRLCDLPAAVDAAFHHAMDGRLGPTLIAIPKDVAADIFTATALAAMPDDRRLWDKHNAKETTSACCQGVYNSSSDTREQIDRVVNLINHAQSPIICAGNGVLTSQNGCALLREIAHKAGIPVVTTLLGLGCFDQTDPLSLGMMGMFGTLQAQCAVRSTDLVLVLGARLDERAVGKISDFAPRARELARLGQGGIIHFDISTETIGKVVKPTGLILGDLSTTLSMVLPGLESHWNRAVWLVRIEQWKKLAHHCEPFHHPELQCPSLHPRQVVRELNRQAHRAETDTIISTGVGEHQMWMAKHFRWRSPRSCLSSGSMGTMGFGLSAAIGAKIARPECEVINVDGDASFCMSMQELLTAVQHHVGVKVIIFNNTQQRMIEQVQHADYDGRVCFARQENADFVLLARSMHCQARRCVLEEDLSGYIDWLLHCQGPALLDVSLTDAELKPTAVSGRLLDVTKCC